MAKERKTITYSVYDQELYNEIKERFPENTGSEENLRTLLHAVAQREVLKTKYAACVAECAELKNVIGRMRQDHDELVDINDEKAHEVSEMQREIESLQSIMNALNERIAEMENNPEIKQVEVEKPLPTGAVIMACSPYEKHLLSVCARYAKCSIKEMLVDAFFMVLQERGAGDYDVPRLKKSALNKIKNEFNTQQ